MAFTDDLENKIQSIYFTLLRKRHLFGKVNKTLNCNSLRVIVEKVKSVINDGQNKGLNVFEIANNIIYNLIICNFFIFANDEMAVLIGYIYLKRQGVVINNYTSNGINNNTTLEQIKIITETWK